jgi:ABC-type sugar transport system ATPase subunit
MLASERRTARFLATESSEGRTGPVAEVRLDHVSKRFPGGTVALHDLNLEIADGELIVLVGPSGCGKTTALRIVAGLEEPTGGSVWVDDQVLGDTPAHARDMAMVFQSYALYPYKTVFENIAFPLKLRRLPRSEIKKRVTEVARLLGLEDYLERKPRQLSGGQRQRVAMGRAIVREPKVFLMDEPLSNLDAKLRTQMRVEIARLQERLNITTIYVTHDQVEAMTLGDRVAVMRAGEIQQLGTPDEIYERPANLFVAGFIGSPPMNIVETTIVKDESGTRATFGDHVLSLDEAELTEWGTALSNQNGRKVALGIRPERFEDASSLVDAPAGRRFQTTVELTERLGAEVMVHFDVDAPPILTEEIREVARDIDSAAVEALEDQRAAGRTACIGRFDARTGAGKEEVVDIAVAPGAMHFFEIESGRRLGV